MFTASAREMRNTRVASMKPMAHTSAGSEVPKIDTMSSASMMVGNEMNASTTRLMVESVHPPAIPAMNPVTTPSTKARMVATRASVSVVRAPWTSRDARSRPR